MYIHGFMDIKEYTQVSDAVKHASIDMIGVHLHFSSEEGYTVPVSFKTGAEGVHVECFREGFAILLLTPAQL